jgi:hypothetical protein
MNSRLCCLCTALFIGLNIIGCGKTMESTWVRSPLVVDGNGGDWSKYPLQYNEDLNLVYGFANDDSLLYCMIRFNDQHLAEMMAIRGFTLWANDPDEEEKLWGIHYQDPSLREKFMNRPHRGRRQGDQQNDPFRKTIPPNGRFTVVRHDTESEPDVRDCDGLNAAAGLEGGLYCFEFSLAFQGAASLSYHLNSSPGKSIKVGFEIAGVSEEEQERIKEEMAERREEMGEERDGMRDGRRGEIGGRPGGSFYMPDMDGDEFWVTLKLATKQTAQQ